ncbi:MAG: extracellular solute-binding protein [Fimbriimonadaceae bacterium]|nr:extracellular solute-binding protein [Fimbriimonadaceae bacterium]
MASRGTTTPIELRIVVWDGDESLRVLRRVANDFEQAHPGIKVKLENVDYRYFFQRLLSQVAGNTAPDIAMLDPQNMQMFAKRGALMPLNPLINQTDGFRLAEYYEPIVDVFRYQSDLYVLPRDIAPIGLIYYNKRMFTEAGLDQPDGNWTWDYEPRPELGSQCFTYCMQQLTRKGDSSRSTVWGFAPSWTGAFTDTVAFSSGARYVNDPQAFESLNFTDPRIIRAFDFVASLANEKKWMPSQTELSSVAQTTAVDLFISQRVAMYQCGIWDVPHIRQALKPGSDRFFEWDITLAPGHIDPTTGEVVREAPSGGSGYAILNSTPHPDAAWKLVQWMAGEPGMKAMAKAGIAQPAIKRLAQGPDWIPGESTSLEQRYPANRIATDQAVPFAVFPPTAEYWGEVSGLVFSKTEPIYLGTSTAEMALTEGNRIASTRLSKILEEERLPQFDWRWGGAVGFLLLFAAIAWVYYPERGKKRTQSERAETRASLWFLSPWIIGTLAFTVGPMIFSLLMSFTNWDIIQAAEWRSLGNYQEAFVQDSRFWNTVKVTAVYTIFSVPLGLIASLALALLLNVRVKGMPIYRTFFYLPVLASAVASSLIWRKVFQPEGGLLNVMLFGRDGQRDPFGLTGWLGLNGQLPNWLGDEKLALPSLIIMSLWAVGGGMVILLAGLQAIPDFYYEAATLDGAGLWQKFRVVTLPMVSPALFFTLITGVIGSLQVFTQAFVMTQGGPNDATRFYMLHLYENSFGNLRMGYASALGWLLFLVVFVITKIQWRLNKYVYYEGAA